MKTAVREWVIRGSIIPDVVDPYEWFRIDYPAIPMEPAADDHC